MHHGSRQALEVSFRRAVFLRERQGLPVATPSNLLEDDIRGRNKVGKKIFGYIEFTPKKKF